MKKNNLTQTKTMSRWGVGPKFAIISILYTLIIFCTQYFLFPDLTFTFISRTFSLITGLTLIAVGIPLFFWSALSIDRYFNAGKLYTGGPYALMRHPIYGSWIVFIVPGIVIISGYLPALSIPIFMLLLFLILIRDEEHFLEKKFGKEYETYKRKVGALFPRIFKSKDLGK